MDLLWDGLREAFGLLVGGDPEVRAIAWRSIEISAAATLLSLLAGVPAGVLLALSPFPGRRLVVALVNTGMGLPPVVVGLFISITLWRSGPLGFLELLYTPAAMVLAQVVIALPIVAGLTLAAVSRPILAARDLEIRRGADLVLRVPVLEVRQGEVLAIIGPNGAGKSSLLRVLALLEAPAAGELRFGGEKVELRTRSLLTLR